MGNRYTRFCPAQASKTETPPSPNAIRIDNVDQTELLGVDVHAVLEVAVMATRLSTEFTQVEYIDLVADSSGLGFGIVGGRSTGVVVKTVVPGAPAHQDSRLKAGDHLLQINGINLHGMSSQQVAMILRQQDATLGVRLTVGRPADPPRADLPPAQGTVLMQTKHVLDPQNAPRCSLSMASQAFDDALFKWQPSVSGAASPVNGRRTPSPQPPAAKSSRGPPSPPGDQQVPEKSPKHQSQSPKQQSSNQQSPKQQSQSQSPKRQSVQPEKPQTSIGVEQLDAGHAEPDQGEHTPPNVSVTTDTQATSRDEMSELQSDHETAIEEENKALALDSAVAVKSDGSTPVLDSANGKQSNSECANDLQSRATPRSSSKDTASLVFQDVTASRELMEGVMKTK